MSKLARAATYLERYAQEIEAAHTIGSRWDNTEARDEHDELLEIATALRAEPERKVEPWIPVSEGLPEGDGAVEFYSDDLRNPTCHVIGYYKDGKWFFAGKEFVNVTHWKPATATPKE